MVFCCDLLYVDFFFSFVFSSFSCDWTCFQFVDNITVQVYLFSHILFYTRVYGVSHSILYSLWKRFIVWFWETRFWFLLRTYFIRFGYFFWRCLLNVMAEICLLYVMNVLKMSFVRCECLKDVFVCHKCLKDVSCKPRISCRCLESFFVCYVCQRDVFCTLGGFPKDERRLLYVTKVDKTSIVRYEGR